MKIIARIGIAYEVLRW
ncbi:MAG: hypothetical protein QXV06_03630, partial [Ignisphaera sp.]